jgi:ribA/ribD-fused uncharacterized protein
MAGIDLTRTLMAKTAFPPVRSVEQLLGQLQQGFKPEYLMFWGHQPARDGRVTPSCFSQWFPTPFEVDGVSYASAEHFMMAGKARLFDDAQTLERILVAATPADAKQLGRQVQGFDGAQWDAASFDIVVRGNLAKFSQHPALGEFLLATGEQVLVEASPVDRIWGIGLAAEDKKASQPEKWRGLNLLGFALMQVRSALRAG